MADKLENPLDTQAHLGLIQAALHPDERKFFKQYLGQDSPDLMDYLLPQGRFANARQVREDIIRSTIHNFIPSASNPTATLGEARSIDPNFPAPPNALSYNTAEGPGAPVATGVTPGQGFTNEQLTTPTTHGTMQDSLNRQYAQRGRPYYTEGPQPSTPAPQEDLSAILPRSHQNLLNSKTHMQGLRPIQKSEATRKSEMRSLYEDISSGLATEEYPGQKGHLAIALGYSQKAPDPSTPQGRKAIADADFAEQKAKLYGSKTNAEITALEAKTASDNAKALDLNTLLKTRGDELQSRIFKNTATGKSAEALMGVTKERQQVQEARLMLAHQRYLAAKENIDPKEMDYWSNEIIDLVGGHFKVQRDEPGMLNSITGGLLGSSGQAHIVPQGQAPTGNPMQFQSGDITAPEQNGLQSPEAIGNINPQTPQTQAAPQAPPSWAKGMKDGEIRKDPSGKRMKRVGSTLQEVK